MKRLIGLLVLMLNAFIYAHAAQPTPQAIDPDLAKYVALQHTNQNYPNFTWQILDSMYLRSVDGSINGYAFILSKTNSEFSTSNDLHLYIVENVGDVDMSKLSQGKKQDSEHATPDQQASRIFNFKNIATVITGATTEAPLILRHFRGIPKFWIQAVMQAKEKVSNPTKSTAIALPVIMMSPMDFRVVSARHNDDMTANLSTNEQTTFEETWQTINSDTGDTKSIYSLRSEHQATEDKVHKRLERYTDPERAAYGQALRERKEYLAKKWEEQRRQWMDQTHAGGGTQ